MVEPGGVVVYNRVDKGPLPGFINPEVNVTSHIPWFPGWIWTPSIRSEFPQVYGNKTTRKMTYDPTRYVTYNSYDNTCRPQLAIARRDINGVRPNLLAPGDTEVLYYTGNGLRRLYVHSKFRRLVRRSQTIDTVLIGIVITPMVGLLRASGFRVITPPKPGGSSGLLALRGIAFFPVNMNPIGNSYIARQIR